MNAESYNRGLMSAGLWFAVQWALGMAAGIPVSVMDVAVDSALMGGSAVVSDVALGSLGWAPTAVSSAVATGAIYTAVQKVYRGSNEYAINFGLAASNDYAVELVGGALAA